MAEQEELSRAEQLAKRAMELSARAEELARQAHEVAGVDEQLAALEAELEALADEEATLDAGMDAGPSGSRTSEGSAGPSDDRRPGGAEPDFDAEAGDWSGLAEMFGDRMEALGERLGELVSHRLDSAFRRAGTFSDRRWGSSAGEVTLAVTAAVPVRVTNHGGRVSVRAGSGSAVVVHWATHGPFAPPEGESLVSVSERDGVVYVETVGRSMFRGVGMDIEVPPGSPLDVNTGGGPVEIDGIGAAVRVKTGGGPINVSGGDGEIVAETGGGSISFRGRPSGESLLRSGGGSIDVLLTSGTSVHVDARGSATSVDVDGKEIRGGRVTATVGDGADGTLTVRTGGGAVRVRQGS